jgi:hypothetical protein
MTSDATAGPERHPVASLCPRSRKDEPLESAETGAGFPEATHGVGAERTVDRQRSAHFQFVIFDS